MVPLTPAALLGARLAELEAVVAESEPVAGAASRGFAHRLRGAALENAPALIGQALVAAAYGGIPNVVFAGFLLGADGVAPEPASLDAFASAVERIRGRPRGGREALTGDDIALLGIAEGLARLAAEGRALAGAAEWLTGIADGPASGPEWTRRARALAADRLDGRGRLRADVDTGDVDAFALDLCLRRAWPARFFQGTGHPGRAAQQDLLARLLIKPAPIAGELERGTVWLNAANALVQAAVLELVPDFDRVVDLLERTQGALKRWVWDEKSARQGVAPAHWLIDSEAHVQAFLWAMLYPAFGDQLRDEQYLPGFGLKQPRYDFGIIALKLIIEVKVLRTPSDFKEVEEQIAGDTGLYLSDPARFDKMVVYIYDDCDAHQPERYASLCAAILQRDARVKSVVIVRRPGMLPDRNMRKPA